MNVYGSVLGGGSGKVEYSTSEKEIGTWTDGSKLYQRTYVGNAPTTTAETQLVSIPSSYKVKNIDGILGLDSANVFVSCHYHLDDANWAATWVASGYLKMKLGSSAAAFGAQYKVTIQYTK